ncbi:MAG: hypothetical protein J5846_04830 [Desulfovibrio sp.]|nr:hypothetical protein [Desulfovibrio sp.]
MERLRIVVLGFALALMLLEGACTKPVKEEQLASAQASFARMAQAKGMRVLDEGYLGVKRLPMDDEHAPILQTPVTLRTCADISELCDTLMRLVPVQVHLVRELPFSTRALPAKAPADPELLDLLGAETQGAPERFAINHDGPFVQLLEQIAAQTGYGWDYERASNTLTLARRMLKTFYLASCPGKVGFSTSLSTQSHEALQGGEQGQSGLEIRKTAQASADNSQNFQASLALDSFSDTVRAVQSMLSPVGHVESHASAGSIAVFDQPEALRRIGRYIRQVNESLSRQVAMKVNVYALETTSDEHLSLDLALLLPRLGAGTLSIAAGSQPLLKSLSGVAQATILDGSLKGSEAMLQALKSLGRARQITSAGIVAMNNQPAPVEAVQRTSYLAGSSIESTEHGSETSLVPGEVTTGFSMTITPHILPERKVVLQYTVHLSSLEGLEAMQSSRASIQLPRVASRAFSQKATMLMGQTLVLAGFEQAASKAEARGGILGLGRERTENRSLIIVTIEVENAAPDIAEQAFNAKPKSYAFWSAFSRGTCLVSA